jgi:multicomponent Na+:H+ antiporter subunit D
MIGGAAVAFMGMILVLAYGSNGFVWGGTMNLARIGRSENLLLLGYVMCFCGFGVKTAMWPCSSWLPKAGVAPTPVTALLHAVAVVKTGAFATMRVTYYTFGAEFVRGTWAQTLILVLIIFTIVYGCSQGVKETHIKRRLAWSTVSNLSYILFGVALATPLGLVGALSHMIAHAMMKICLFFCAGAVIYKTGRNYLHEIAGFGRKMPGVFICFTLSGLALMGLPGMSGFISKWNLAKAAVESGTVLGYVGIVALLISALLTALYIMPVSVKAFFPGKGFDYTTISDVKDPNWMMLVPLTLLVIVIFYLGVNAQPLTDFFTAVAAGM